MSLKWEDHQENMVRMAEWQLARCDVCPLFPQWSLCSDRTWLPAQFCPRFLWQSVLGEPRAFFVDTNKCGHSTVHINLWWWRQTLSVDHRPRSPHYIRQNALIKSGVQWNHLRWSATSTRNEFLMFRRPSASIIGTDCITTWREHFTSVAFAVLLAMQESAVATPSAWVLCPSLETSSATDMAAALSASSSGMLASADSSWCDWSASARSPL